MFKGKFENKPNSSLKWSCIKYSDVKQAKRNYKRLREEGIFDIEMKLKDDIIFIHNDSFNKLNFPKVHSKGVIINLYSILYEPFNA